MAEAQTEATTNTYVPTIDAIVAAAYRRAGLLSVQQSPSTVQGSVAREQLNILADALESEGVFMRSVQFGYVALLEDVNVYELPEYVLDVVGNGAYISPSQSTTPFQAQSETPVFKKDRDTYQSLSSKGAQSQPTLYYFAREAPMGSLYLWPTPGASEVGGSIRFQFHQTRPDMTNGSLTMPFERYWSEYFIWALAHRLAVDNSLPLDRVSMLDQNAATKKEYAKGYSKQNVGMQASISHATGYGRGRRRR